MKTLFKRQNLDYFKPSKQMFSSGNSIFKPSKKSINAFKNLHKGLKMMRNKDIDNDGVLNIFDCSPLNPYRHGVKPSKLMARRLRRLPIFITERPAYYGQTTKKFYHVLEKQAPKEPKQRALSLIKKYPEIVGEIERKKPRAVLITTSRGRGTETGWATSTKYGTAGEGIESGKGLAVVRVESIPYARKGKKYGKFERHEAAKTAVHELEHVRQFQAWEGKPKLQTRMEKGRYSQRRQEVLAREKETKLSRTRPDIEEKLVKEVKEEQPRKAKKWLERYEEYKKRREERKAQAFREIFKEEIKDEEVEQNERTA